MKWTAKNIRTRSIRRLFAAAGLLAIMTHTSPAKEVGANDFRISTMGTPGNASIDATDPSIAYSATSDMYVVVWEADDDTGGFVDNKKEIYARRFNASTGAAIGSRVRISTSGAATDATRDGEDPAIAWDSTLNRFLIVWKGNPGTMAEDEVFGQVVDANLADVSAEFRISSVGPNGDALRAPFPPSVAYNSDDGEYLVVWSGDYAANGYLEVYGQRVSATGAEIGSDFQISDQAVSLFQGAFNPDVVYNATNSEYLVVWAGEEVQDNQEIYGQRLTGAGAAVGNNDFRISDMGPDNDTTYAASYPTIAWNSIQNEYLVVWKGDDNTPPLVGGEDEIFGQRLSATGAELGSNDFRISFMGNDAESNASIRDDYDAYGPDVAFSPTAGEYLVTWEGEDDFEFLTEGEEEIFGQRVTASTGALNGPNLRLSDMGPERSGSYAGEDASVAAGPSGEWLIVFEGEDNNGSMVDGEDEIFGQRYSSAQLNNPPRDALLSRSEFSDDVPNGGVVADIGALDADTSDSFTFTLIAGSGDTDNSAFTVSANQLIANTDFDASIKSSYSIRLRVNDGSAPAETTYTLTVIKASETLLGNRMRLSTILPDGTDNGFDHAEAATVYNATSDEFLVAWFGESNQGGQIENDNEIFVRRVNAVTQAPIGVPIRISDVRGLGNTTGNISAVHLAWNSTDNEYLVVWVADDTGTDNENEIYGQRLTSAAAEIGANDFRISSLGPNGDINYGASEVKVAYNSTANEYLVVFEGDHNGTGLVVNQQEIFIQRINAQSGALTGSMNRISNANADNDGGLDADKPAVAWNSQNNLYLVVWIDERVNSEDEIYGQLLNADGSENGSDFRISTLGPEGNTSYDADLCSVAYNSADNEFFVVWEGEDNTAPLVQDEVEIFGRRINAQTGALLGSQTRYSDAGPNGNTSYRAQDPQVAYGAAKNEYLIVWLADNNENSQVAGEYEVFAQRVNASTGAEIGTDERISEMGPVGSDDYDARYANLAYDNERHRYMIVWDSDDNTSPLIEGENEVYAQFWQLPPPKVSGITRNNTNPTTASTLSWTVSFNESVTGIDVADFSLSLTGSSGSIQSVSASSGTSISVTAHNVSGDGSVGLNLVDNDSITGSISGIPLGGSGAANGSYSGPQYTVTGAPPGFSMSFSPNPISVGQTSTLTFTIDNTGSSEAATGLDFTNVLPAGLAIATPANASTTCTGGTLTAIAGSGSVSYTGGSISAGSSCTVQADVVGNVAGTQVNTSGALTSSAGNSGTSSDTLSVEKQLASVTLSGTSQIFNGSARIVAATTAPTNLTVNITYDGNASAPTNAGTYTVIAHINDPAYSGSTTGILTVAKAVQSIGFTLPATHSVNSALALSATSGSPGSFSYSIAYGTAAISNANLVVFGAAEAIGIVATQAETMNWNTASVTNAVTAVKDAATVTLSDTKQTYSGSARSVTATTVPAGLPVDILYEGSSTAPSSVGQYNVSATINSGRYTGNTNGVLTVSKAMATVSLSGTNQTYDGTARFITATTTPSNLTVDVTYNGLAIAPTNAGNHVVIATVNEAMYEGGITGILSIAKADQTITFPALSPQSVLDTVALSATADSGEPVGFSVAAPGSISDGTNLSFSAAGRVEIFANQPGDSNWNPAPQVARSLDVIGVITNVSPAQGTIFGGTEVVIEGLWLGNGTDITNVALCGVEATVVSQNVHQVTVLSGAINSAIAITGAVEVVSSYGTAVLTNAFVYNPVPEAPVAISAVDITPNCFTARWLPAADTTGYYVDVSDSTNFTDFVGVYSNWNAGNATAGLVTGLVDGVTYWYRVRAANAFGSSIDSNMIEAPVGDNTPYIQYEITNGVASAGSTNAVDLTDLFHGHGMIYSVVSNSNPSLVTASIDRDELVLVYASGVTGSAEITVRVTDSTGFWVETTITVQVVEQPGTSEGGIAFNLQNGVFEQVVSVTNNSASRAAQSIALTVFNLSAGATVHNATGQDALGNPMIRWNGTLAPLSVMNFTVQYYSSQGTVPSSDVVAALSLEDVEDAIQGIAFSLNGSPVMISGTQSFLIEFTATPGRTYYVQYKDALGDEWTTVPRSLEALVNKVQWIDSGPPSTLSAPIGGSRFYRVLEANNR